MRSIAAVTLAASAQAALADPFAIVGTPADLSRSSSYNPNYANSFAETSWPQNPAIRYPGNAAPGITTSFVSPYDPVTTYGALPVAATTSFNSALTPVYTNNYASYAPYGGSVPWPYNKPWSPVSPSGDIAVLTNGATGPITTITPAPVLPASIVPAIAPIPVVPAIAPVIPLARPTIYATQPAAVVTTPITGAIYTPTNYSPLPVPLAGPFAGAATTIAAFGTVVPVVPAGPVPAPIVPPAPAVPSPVIPPIGVPPASFGSSFGSGASFFPGSVSSFPSSTQLSSQVQGTSFAPPVMTAPSGY